MPKNVKKNEPLVSIITLTYNKFSGLNRTIESVSIQSYKNVEYIIADDGSNNYSKEFIEELLKKYGIRNYHIFHNSVNSGTVFTAKEASKRANGKYILFLSEGDYFTNHRVVSSIVARFIKTDADLLTVRRIAYYEDKALFFMPNILSIPIIRSFRTRKKQYEAFITTHYWDMASGSAMYYSKRILEKLDYFDEKYRLWEDGPFLEKYLQKHKLTFAYDIIGVWYEWGGVSTGTVNPLLEKDRLLFDVTDRQNMKGHLSKFANRYIEYIGKRSKCASKKELNSLRMHYPLIMISHINYTLLKKVFRKIDSLYLRISRKWKR